MEQRIEYKGMTSQPSDYQCGDGEMKMAVNAEYRDGGYHATRIPNGVQYNYENFIPLYVHKADDINSIIGLQKKNDNTETEETKETYLLVAYNLDEENGNDIISHDIVGGEETEIKGKRESFGDFCSIGRIVSFILDGEIHYLTYNKNMKMYNYIPCLPHFVNIHFRAARQNLDHEKWTGATGVEQQRIFKGWGDEGCNVFDAINSYIVKGGVSFPTALYGSKEGALLRAKVSLADNSKHSDNTYKGSFSAAEDFILGMVSSIKKELDKKNLFMYPVVLRYAMRMYDGSYINVSPPILIFPSNDTPKLITQATIANQDNYTAIYNITESKVCIEAYEIEYQVDSSNDENFNELNNLEPYKDLISSIDFFLSPPLYTIDTSQLDMQWVEDDKVQPCKGYYGLCFKKKDGYKSVKDISSFHLVRSIPIKEFIDQEQKTKWHNILEKDKQVLVDYTQKEVLQESTSSNIKINASHLHSINGRLLASNITKKHMGGLNLAIEAPIVVDCDKNGIGGFIGTDTYAKRINAKYKPYQTSIQTAFNMECNILFGSKKYERLNDNQTIEYFKSESKSKCRISHPYTDDFYGVSTSGDSTSGSYLRFYIPVFLSIPESNASYAIISSQKSLDKDNNGSEESPGLAVELKQSDFLNLSYSLDDGRGTDSNAYFYTTSAPKNTGYKNLIIPDIDYEINKNLVKLSEVNNPFVFKDGNSASCGAGSVLAIASNSRAVSQGQFGQYPLFAFCTDGVYAIGVGTDGTLQNCSPYSYDVITDSKSVSNMESSVVFVTKQGVIALGGEGRQLLLSADKTADYKYDEGKEGHQKKFVEEAVKNVVGLSSTPAMTDLHTYLTTGARIAYDYPHGRLIVYNPNHDYSYVMEAASGMWSVMTQKFHSNLNVYEECLMVKEETEVVNEETTTKYNVYNYSTDNVVEKQHAYLITRPFKLGYPDVHKTIQSIIQRGVFCSKNDVQQCMYGSNDLYNWVPVWSSKDIYMRGFMGTGYKYYRMILFIPEFKQDETLQGASVSFEPRMTNKQR